ncbi:MAG TPA: alkaline phosphatase, partial [Armatimonadota bacterium]|nr:alkaline phosphatase [Armatimonadota bacterium]
MNTTVRMNSARRTLLVLLLLSLALPVAAAQHARNVILMIGDGMGPSQVELARNYSVQILKKPLQITEVAAAGHMGVSFTRSANALVTDSAAGATAFASGHKTNNGMISELPDGKSLPTILELARDHGKRTGIVATATVTDATPACFASHVAARGKDQDIAAQMLAAKPDVLLGGGTDSFLPKAAGGHRDDDRNLETDARAEGYTVVSTRQELARASGKVIGLFGSGNLSSELVREQEKPNQPRLAEMTEKALQLLSGDKRGFFLMVEGSQIDKRCHSNDVTGALHETLAFDDAVS